MAQAVAAQAVGAHQPAAAGVLEAVAAAA